MAITQLLFTAGLYAYIRTCTLACTWRQTLIAKCFLILPVYFTTSTGVGQSGAFCVISTAIECVKAEGTVDIFHGVKHLRTQHPHMVRTLVSVGIYSHIEIGVCLKIVHVPLHTDLTHAHTYTQYTHLTFVTRPNYWSSYLKTVSSSNTIYLFVYY